MTSSLHGAKTAKKELEKLAKRLNSEGLVPEQSYRRNHSNYPYLCYINNTIGLLASKNYHVIPIFIARASEHDQKHPAPEGFERYRELATEYLLKLTEFIDLYTEADLEHFKGYAVSFLEQYQSYRENT
ncbi:hypothetical protein SG34_032935 [Thalassomonas viridans]|uniref:Uncharacterized protein n=1 Tax=Thalassomonas viridans TaxID=137584 RepID=A0AAF0CAM3_9GAMM|nr:hypothetical protein [Thalassomonas viridans]WDE08712.1 hypothetical protein SG34_032935 [Thalassomonas viridans]